MTINTPMTPSSVGPGVAALASGAGSAPSGGGPSPLDILRQAQASLSPDGEVPDDEAGNVQTEPTEADLDVMADAFEGKAAPKAPAKEASAKAPQDAKQRALARLKVPDAIKSALEGLPPEAVDGWLETLVEHQGNTDSALQERDRQISTLRSDLDALRSDLGKGPKPGAKAANAHTSPDQRDDEGDPDADLESLRDTDPELAGALENSQKQIRDLRKREREMEKRLEVVEAREKSLQQNARREQTKAALATLQSELGVQYPQLNDLQQVLKHVTPRASALLAAGVHTNPLDAMREAAHAAFVGVRAEDEAAARQSLGRPPGSAPQVAPSTAPPRKQMSRAEAGQVFVELQAAHPDWTMARLKSEALRRAGKVVADQPFIR